MDLSLYKDEAQLDKTPRKRKRGQKSDEADDDDEEDDDYEETPRKKKSVKKSPAAKPSRASTKRAATYESSESDGENLMEIQKKAKKQVCVSTTVQQEHILTFKSIPGWHSTTIDIESFRTDAFNEQSNAGLRQRTKARGQARRRGSS